MSPTPTPLDALKQAVEIAGSQSALARLLGVTQAGVWGWLNRSKVLPGEHARIVERETGVPKELLRPDLYATEQLDPPSCMSIGSVAPGGAIENFDRAALLKRKAGNA